MDELPEILGPLWASAIKSENPPHGNFEQQYSWLRANGRSPEALTAINKFLHAYFAVLELPPTPTIYDHLVLGLRPKDIIATFNWDPLLLAAYCRNRYVVPLPDIRFLHGCVSYHTCNEHDVLGGRDEACPSCGRRLKNGTILFPEENKNYANDAIIQRDWQSVTDRLSKAFHLTIFGYSGPATDKQARELLLNAWKRTPIRDYSHVEFIDIASSETLSTHWREFIPFHHDIVHETFFDSSIALYPRRTAEWKTAASFYGVPSHAIGPAPNDSLDNLHNWFRDLAKAEASPELK